MKQVTKQQEYKIVTGDLWKTIHRKNSEIGCFRELCVAHLISDLREFGYMSVYFVTRNIKDQESNSCQLRMFPAARRIRSA